VASFYVYINFHLPAESRTWTCAYRTVSSYLKCLSITSGPSIDVGHPLALMLPTFLADATVHICSVGAVLKVAAAGCCQGGLECCQPFVVGLSQPPNLVRSQAKVTERSPERLNRCRCNPGVAGVSRQAAVLVPCGVRVPWHRRFGIGGIQHSYIRRSTS
jgi:hypothetical protein